MRPRKNQSLAVRLRFAFTGLWEGVRAEHSLRYQLVALGGVVALLAIYRPEAFWWALVALAASAVLTAELLNTALERLVDHLHPQVHEQIRLVKDCAAAAVLIASCGALAVGIALAVRLFG